MTHEDDTRSLVRRAGDDLPVSPAPVQDLLQWGRQARRRRTLTTIGVVAATVLVVTSGAVAVGSQLSNDASTNPVISTPTGSTPTATSPNLTAPPGTRLVGRNGIGIAVPSSWIPFPVACRNYNVDVIMSAGRADPCSSDYHSTDEVAIGTSRGAVINTLRSGGGPETTTRLAAGISVSKLGPMPCPGYCDSSIFYGAVVSPDRDVSFVVIARGRALVEQILDSAFAVPAGYVDIPPLTDRAALFQRGLVVHQETRTRPKLPWGRILGVSPPPGSLVARGSDVTVLTSSRPVTRCWAAPVEVVAPTNSYRPNQGYGSGTLTVHIGDPLSLWTIGPCGDNAVFGPLPSAVLHRQGDRVLVAAHTGEIRISALLPMCAKRIPPCSSAYEYIGYVTVRVRP